MPILPGAEPFRFDGGRTGALLVHGFTGCPQSMRPWGEYLAAHGLSVLGPRLPGHGTRWQDLNLTTWQDWYGEAERALDDLRSRCDHVFVMGLSMGGTLTLRLAEERGDDISGICLVNPSILTENKAFRFIGAISRGIPSLKGVGSDIKAPGVVELAYPRTPLRAAASLGRLWPLVRADLGKITVPVLLLRSSVDHVVEPSNGPALLAALGSDDVRDIVLEDSYHVATLDNDKERIFEESLAFVRQHAGVGA